MAYKDRPLTGLVNRAYIYFTYDDLNGQYRSYSEYVDVLIDTYGDLDSDKAFAIIFKFTVPDDFPSQENISHIYSFEIWLFHTDEGDFYNECIYLSTNNLELLFGKTLQQGEDANIMFTIPALYFLIFTT